MLEQDNWVAGRTTRARTARTGMQGQDSQDRTDGEDSRESAVQDRKQRTGPTEHDSKDRAATVGAVCITNAKSKTNEDFATIFTV